MLTFKYLMEMDLKKVVQAAIMGEGLNLASQPKTIVKSVKNEVQSIKKILLNLLTLSSDVISP